MAQRALVAAEHGAGDAALAVTNFVVHVHRPRLVVVAAEDAEGNVFLGHQLAAALHEDEEVQPHEPIHGDQRGGRGREAEKQGLDKRSEKSISDDSTEIMKNMCKAAREMSI